MWFIPLLIPLIGAGAGLINKPDDPDDELNQWYAEYLQQKQRKFLIAIAVIITLLIVFVLIRKK